MENDNLKISGGGNKEMNKWLIIVVIMVVLAVVLMGLYWFFTKDILKQEKAAVENKIMVEQKAGGRMYLNPGELFDAPVGAEIAVDIFIDTEGHNINAGEATLAYNKDILEAVSIETEDSVLSMGVEAKIEDGLVRVGRGEPGDGIVNDNDDGFTGAGLLAKIIFRLKNEGNAKVDFVAENSNLYLDDGRGTKMEMEYGGGLYSTMGEISN